MPAVCDLRELLLVLAAVVGAEQEFAVGHDDANVGLRTAGVAAIECGELVRGVEFFDRTGRLGVLGQGSSSWLELILPFINENTARADFLPLARAFRSARSA